MPFPTSLHAQPHAHALSPALPTTYSQHNQSRHDCARAGGDAERARYPFWMIFKQVLWSQSLLFASSIGGVVLFSNFIRVRTRVAHPQPLLGTHPAPLAAWPAPLA